MTQSSFKVFFHNLKLLYKEYDEVRRVRGTPSKDKHNRARSRAYKARKRSEAAKRRVDAKKAQDELKQLLTVVKPKVEYRSDFSRFMENGEISRRREADYSTSESGVGTTQADLPSGPPPPPPPPFPPPLAPKVIASEKKARLTSEQKYKAEHLAYLEGATSFFYHNYRVVPQEFFEENRNFCPDCWASGPQVVVDNSIRDYSNYPMK
jgi:hypothetical protein